MLLGIDFIYPEAGVFRVTPPKRSARAGAVLIGLKCRPGLREQNKIVIQLKISVPVGVGLKKVNSRIQEYRPTEKLPDQLMGLFV